MLERFTGIDGRRVLTDALCSQKLVAGNRVLADWMSTRVKVREVSSGEVLIGQGDPGNSVYMILSGNFDVLVNDRRINGRTVNDHVGEMAAIEPSQPRAATVRAVSSCVVAEISEPDLAEAGARHPEIYRCVARELARRLQQRNMLVGSARERTKVFVISSAEALSVAREIQNAFAHDDFVTTVWTDGVFRAGNIALESLIEAVEDSDFAVAIAHADDIAFVRGTEWPAPRDNVIFELGLFMGRLGKDRAILMEPRHHELKLPSDLAGLTTITYKFERGKDAAALIAPACNALREHIKLLGPNL